MNYTENYQLPQWEKTDRIMMEDFNGFAEKLEAALTELNNGKAEVAFGSYVGNGKSGSSNPNQIAPGFAPRAVIIMGNGYVNGDHIVMFRPYTDCALHSANSSCSVKWLDDGVRWYAAGDGLQFNRTNYTYYYLAVK